MKELLRRIFKRPGLAVELLVSSLFLNILALVSPLFVILILNRYVTYGYTGTLVTLTSGMLLAVILGKGFNIARTRLAGAVSAEPDDALAKAALAVLSRARVQHLERIPKARLNEIIQGVQVVQSACDAVNVVNVIDLPFFLVFAGATFLLSPALGLVVLFFICVSLVAGMALLSRSKRQIDSLQDVVTVHRGLVAGAAMGADTVRAFRGAGFVRELFHKQVERIAATKRSLANSKSLSQAMLMSASELMRIFIYAIGAIQVVRGDLSVGALIGASILGSRAHQQVSQFMQSYTFLAKSDKALKDLRDFVRLPLEPESGTALRAYSGRLEFKDVAFRFPEGAGPLFESLNLTVEPGEIVVVNGFNGAGKTTLARLLVGLISPVRGQVLVDGVDLRQVAPAWWRSRLIYMPQDPYFLNGTIRDNICFDREEACENLSEIVGLAGLRNYLDTSPTGIDTVLRDGGRNLSRGIRRRIALARALTVLHEDERPPGLAIFDEPTEGLDTEGCEALYSVMNMLARKGVTIIAMTHDPQITKAARHVLDLSSKPVPNVSTRAQGGGHE